MDQKHLNIAKWRRLEHYKCLLVDDIHQGDYTITNLDPKDKIMQVYHKIATTTLHSGASLDMAKEHNYYDRKATRKSTNQQTKSHPPL
jgi:hypothetical protein